MYVHNYVTFHGRHTKSMHVVCKNCQLSQSYVQVKRLIFELLKADATGWQIVDAVGSAKNAKEFQISAFCQQTLCQVYRQLGKSKGSIKVVVHGANDFTIHY